MGVRFDPYRAAPAPACEGKQEEAANCRWCRWADDPRDVYADCTHPLLCHGTRGERCRVVNKKGACRLYSPSGLTRVLRLVGLRRPVRRPSDVA